MGSKIFISGLVNVESTLRISEFPITYSPIEYLFDGISSKVSGVGYNVSKALSTLGNEVHLHSLTGDDSFSKLILQELAKNNIGAEGIYHFLEGTPQSIVIYDSEGKRKIYCDLKNIQESSYPASFIFDTDYDIAILTNVNFSREFFSTFKEKGIKIATDCHVLKDINSKYDKEFLENADIIFMSNEGIKGNEESFMRSLINTYNQEIIVISMGAQGSMIYDRIADEISFVKARTVRPIVNTVGAGDALFSAFIHFFVQGDEPVDALTYATYFASYKIGANGGGEGFLTEDELVYLMNNGTL
ncbi:MAG: carbohydrate kinase family protein [Clostridia bacterium]|nr:carbohydrate kinase family protein [Clostridia bacterium]